MPQPYLSVIIPAYQAQDWVGEAVDSALSQANASFEVVVADDASSDGTWESLQSYARHPQVRLHRTERNAGPGRARNLAAELARGEYLVFLDADDVFCAGALQDISDTLRRYPQVDLLYGQSYIQDGGRAPVRADLPVWDLLGCPFSGQGITLRRSLFLALGGFDETLPACEDWDLWLRVAEQGVIQSLNRVVAVWRRRPQGRSRSLSEGILRDIYLEILGRAVGRRYGLRLRPGEWKEQTVRAANKRLMKPTQKFCRSSPEILGKVVEEEAIILDLGTGNYYSLEQSGAWIWEQLEAGASLQQLEQGLVERYQVGAEQAREDLVELLEQLLAQGLILAAE